MGSSDFYWESDGDRYTFDPSKRYLVYFKGGFSPCHRGHFESVKRFTDIGPNVKVLINQMESNRHGIPYKFKKEIWRIYIKELLPRRQVYLRTLSSAEEILDFVRRVDVVIYVRGDEGYDREDTKSTVLNRFYRIIRSLKRQGKKMDFLYTARPLAATLSASKFVQALMENNFRSFKEKYDKLSYFLPDGLSIYSAKYIITELENYQLR